MIIIDNLGVSLSINIDNHPKAYKCPILAQMLTKMCQYANHIIYQHSKTNFEYFAYVFAKQIKVHQFFFISKLPKKVKKSSILARKSPFKGKKLSKFIVIGPKNIDNDTGKFVRLSAFR
jgi:hypothetical protein